MDLLGAYESGSDNDDTNEPSTSTNKQKPSSTFTSSASTSSSSQLALIPTLNAAPDVDDMRAGPGFIDPHAKSLKHNPKYEELFAPVQGPTHPYRPDVVSSGLKNHLRGWVEEDAISPFVFHQQYHTFHSFGYAADPAHGSVNTDTYAIVGDIESASKFGGGTILDTDKRRFAKPSQSEAEANPTTTLDLEVARLSKAVREACLDGEVGVSNPFVVEVSPLIAKLLEAKAPESVKEMLVSEFGWDAERQQFTESVDRVLLATQLGMILPDETDADDTDASSSKKGKKRRRKIFEDAGKIGEWKGPWAKVDVVPAGLPEEDREKLAQEIAARESAANKQNSRMTDAVDATVTYHGGEMFDYQGRTFINPPSDLKPHEHDCFIPKKLIHTWKGHSKGVHAIRFFPKYAHLLISAGMDSKIKIWDVYKDQQCVQTYHGHSAAVRDICWNHDGSKFLSASYDRYVRLWDTETGKVLTTVTTRRTPYVVKFHPDQDKQHEFVVGGSDKKIVQWDIRTEKIVQEYDQHLGAVNTITFIDENRRFVTSSDDKSLRVWEWGIPVVIKYICEPHMHSMPATTLSPNGNWLACQSLDNQILLYSTKDRFRLNRKKRFAGHTNAGYACQVNFSPDGKYVMSGDGDGKLWFWDFKSTKVFRTMRAHKGVCIGCEWHPIEPSRVATCGWDGDIHYWD